MRTTATILLIGLAAVVVVTGSADDREKPPPVAAVPAAAATGDPSRYFSVLRRDRGASDLMPAAARAQLAGPLESQGTDLDTARAVRTSPAAPAAWVVGGPGDICLATPTPEGFGINCATTAQAVDGGLSGQLVKSDRPGSEQIVVGLLPDGVDEVRVVPAEGRARTERVRENVLIVSARVGDRVSYSDERGPHDLVR